MSANTAFVAAGAQTKPHKQESFRINREKILSWHKLCGGFILIELLMAIAVVAILAVVVVLALNHAELLKRSRDTVRVNELASINRVLGYYQVTASNPSFGLANRVYISLPDATSTCASWLLPALPSGWQYVCATQANFRNIDGTGWIPVNFTASGVGAPFAALPVDPINEAPYYYTYITGGSWELTAALESKSNRGFNSKSDLDSGDDPFIYEVGDDLKIGLYPIRENYLTPQEKIDLLAILINRVKRASHKSLLQIIGSICSDCICRTNLLPPYKNSYCISQWENALNKIQQEAGSLGLNFNFYAFKRDNFVSPYLLDENETEGGYCGQDGLRSVGEDKLYATSDDFGAFNTSWFTHNPSCGNNSIVDGTDFCYQQCSQPNLPYW